MRRSAYAANRRQSNHRYVLGASFFVGNKVVTSHGLLKHWTGENLNTAIGFRGQMAECVNGHRFYSFNADLGPCSVCDAAERKTEPQPLLFPRFGFSTAAWDRPQFRGAPTPPIGKPELLTISRLNNERPDFGGLKGVVARYQEDGELLVINSGSGERGFAVCLNCGYSESELTAFKHGPEELPKSYEHHAPLQFAPTKNGRTWVNCGASVCADSPSAYFWTCCWRSNSIGLTYPSEECNRSPL